MKHKILIGIIIFCLIAGFWGMIQSGHEIAAVDKLKAAIEAPKIKFNFGEIVELIDQLTRFFKS